MTRPRLSTALTWEKFQHSVLSVFTESLRRLAARQELPRSEEPINFELLMVSRDVLFEKVQAGTCLSFLIFSDIPNQPETDDTAESRRLKKRPDFKCAITDEHAQDAGRYQVYYVVECKRLGQAEQNWVLNENYCEHGMLRFIRTEHGYAKTSASAAMVGYLQSMTPDEVLEEVNTHAATKNIPSLVRAASAWAAKDVTVLSNRVVRDDAQTALDLNHLWLDLRHCTFKQASPKKAAARKNVSKTTVRKKTVKKKSAKKGVKSVKSRAGKKAP